MNDTSDVTEIAQTAQDAVTEAVESDGTGPKEPEWHKWVALTTLIMALLAALAGLLAGVTAHQALLDSAQEILELSSLEGDRLATEVLRSKHDLLIALGETPDRAEIEALAAFEARMQETRTSITGDEGSSSLASHTHLIRAIAVTLLSLGITLGGMAVIVERKLLWIAVLLFGAVGAVGVAFGVMVALS